MVYWPPKLMDILGLLGYVTVYQTSLIKEGQVLTILQSGRLPIELVDKSCH